MWKREEEFKALLESQSGKLTQEGLELLTRIAVRDEKECFKHVSVLLERQMRKVKLKYRTNVLHILSYVLRTSFAKFKAENKYAKRLSNRMTAIFELLKDCSDDQKPTIARVLLAWKREHLFCKPLMEDIYKVLGWQPYEPVDSPVACTLQCSFDSCAKVVENNPKELPPPGEDVQAGHGGASVGGSAKRSTNQCNVGSTSQCRSNNGAGRVPQGHTSFSWNSDKGSGYWGNFDERSQEYSQGGLCSRKRQRGTPFSQMQIEGLAWHPPIAPDPYYSPYVVDPNEVTQPLKKRMRGSSNSGICGTSMDEERDSEQIATWILNVRKVVQTLDPDLSIFERGRAVAKAINRGMKAHDH